MKDAKTERTYGSLALDAICVVASAVRMGNDLDHSLRIWVENVDELTPQQQANVDYTISVSEFEAELVRSPELPKSD
jgi:hypothetical protein